MTSQEYQQLLTTAHKLENLISKFKHMLATTQADINLKAISRDLSSNSHNAIAMLEEIEKSNENMFNK